MFCAARRQTDFIVAGSVVRVDFVANITCVYWPIKALQQPGASGFSLVCRNGLETVRSADVVAF